MTAPLAERLEPVQNALADLESEYWHEARGHDGPDDEPATWAAWADLHTALMAVRAAQCRAARALQHCHINVNEPRGSAL